MGTIALSVVNRINVWLILSDIFGVVVLTHHKGENDPHQDENAGQQKYHFHDVWGLVAVYDIEYRIEQCTTGSHKIDHSSEGCANRLEADALLKLSATSPAARRLVA